jgi:hypothetical protein
MMTKKLHMILLLHGGGILVYLGYSCKSQIKMNTKTG